MTRWIPFWLRKLAPRRETTIPPQRNSCPPVRLLTIVILILLVALGVRLLMRHDSFYEARKVQKQEQAFDDNAADGYKQAARHIREGGISAFFNPSSPLSNPDYLGHPPGYPILIATVSSLVPDEDFGIQMFQIFCDALAAIMVFLIALQLFSLSTSIVAGLLVALSPQFAWNSVLFLPDTLSVFPILFGFFLLLLASRQKRLLLVVAAGAFFGISIWLRANGMFLALFVSFFIPLLFPRSQRVRAALTLIGGALLLIAPLTIRNAVVYRHFIPVSLGAGQTFLEGIADYDKNNRFGIPNTDLGIMTQEAAQAGRPDYKLTLFGPDGIQRERQRLARAFKVVRSNPFWFAGVMIRRAVSMIRLERVRLISTKPAVTHPLNSPPASVLTLSPAQLVQAAGFVSRNAEAKLAPDGSMLTLTGDGSKYDEQFQSQPLAVKPDTDYVLQVPLKTEQGRIRIAVAGTVSNNEYAFLFSDPTEGLPPENQPFRTLQLSFVTGAKEQHVSMKISNGGSVQLRPVVQLGNLQLIELGPASYLWTRYLRAPLRIIQQLFITAVLLPLVLAGAFLLVRRGRSGLLLILCAVPAYYFLFQSALHTEYRYVMAIHYFLLILAAYALVEIIRLIQRFIMASIGKQPPQTH